MSLENVKVGDIIHRTWGYSMTFHDFYVVTRVTAKTVVLNEAEKVYLECGDPFRPVVSTNGMIKQDGKVERKNKTKYFGNVWDGEPKTEDHLD